MEGEYYLVNAREMASGFLLKLDGDFQFFFSYGALDRHGSGKWQLNGNKLVLNSVTRAGNDFSLVESRKTPGDEIILKMDTVNPAFARHIYCSLENGIDGSWSSMDGNGEISFPRKKIDTICLLLEFCPERFSAIAVDPEHTEFIVRIEATIMEVFFDNFSLQAGKAILSGRHPLMEGNEFKYEKQ
ncbi:MAG TPA: hypothetical protein VGO58_11475 [Chitinophagaceae bacterium]|jgi:hypothetical protein|nr:hypothetical protein [Chitinophagaceae bacterium]